MPTNNHPLSKRIYSYDILRVIAALAVIMIHTTSSYISSPESGASELFWGSVFNGASRFAVPVFIMISGALMLDEDKAISTGKILKTAFGFFVLLVIWSVLYAVASHILEPLLLSQPIDLSAFIRALFYGHYHMWYLFVLIGLYLVTPVLRLFIRRENMGTIRGFLIFSTVICFAVPFINEIINIATNTTDELSAYIENYRFDYACEYLLYYVWGWYLTNAQIGKRARWILCGCGILGLAVTVIFTQPALVGAEYASDAFFSNAMLNVFAYSLAIFMFAEHHFRNISGHRFQKLLGQLSRLSFGFYITHCVFLLFIERLAKVIAPVPVRILVTFFTTAVITAVCTWILSRIPILKKLIRC